jgi:hypothetical protein
LDLDRRTTTRFWLSTASDGTSIKSKLSLGITGKRWTRLPPGPRNETVGSSPALSPTKPLQRTSGLLM